MRGAWGMRMRVLLGSVAIAIACGGAGAGQAYAAEHVVNGNFDGGTTGCNAGGCLSLEWIQGGGGSMSGIGSLCDPVIVHCSDDGSGYHTASRWARVGAGYGASGYSVRISSVAQNVSIPPGQQTTLSFVLHMPSQANVLNSFLTVKLGGTRVFFADKTDQPTYAFYKTVSVDVSALSGDLPLGFEGTSVTSNQPAPGFDIDTVSLQSQPAATPTGQRAAALAKCKKKNKAKRKKCKKRANALPL